MRNTDTYQRTLIVKAVECNERWYYKKNKETARKVHAIQGSGKATRRFTLSFFAISAALLFVLVSPGLAGYVPTGIFQSIPDQTIAGSTDFLADQVAIISAPIIIILVGCLIAVFCGIHRQLGSFINN